MLKNKKTIIGIIISVLFLVLIFYNVDLKELFETFKQFNIKSIVIIVAIYAFSMIIRAVRWANLLECNKKYNFFKLNYAWVIGNLMNAFLPARAGDIWRAYEIGANSQESKMKLFGSVMLERILDGVSICTILYLCVLMYAKLPWLKNMANFSMLLFGGCLLGFYLIVKLNKIEDVCTLINKNISRFPSKIANIVEKISKQFKLFVNGFYVLKSNYYSFMAIFLSFIIWLLECVMTYYVIRAFGINCPISAALFVICFVALGTMIPSSSIFVGPYQYAFILALGLYHIDKSEALAVALVHQSILMGALLLFSLFLFICNWARNYIKESSK